jgi:DNA topoisomerase II
MIIDGALVVSKKKKDVLVAELRRLNFRPFPKKSDARKAGEIEDIVMGDAADDSADEGVEGGAKDYDYLLGMPIWSLTQERVDKLLRQIGDKEVEIDDLIKLTPKDLWNRDLDDFIAEWHYQLDDEKKRAKKRAAVGRRGSAKLGLAAKGAKRKRKGFNSDDSDDDFMVAKKKPAVKSVLDRVKSKQPSALMSYFTSSQPTAEKPAEEPEANSGAVAELDDDFMDIDDDIPKVVAVKQRGKQAGSKAAKPAKVSKPAVKDELSDVDDVFAAVERQADSRKASDTAPSRQGRAAAKKAKYVMPDSDSDESNGDDMLGDVSMMVKGIESGENSGSAGARPLFSNTAGRPSSSQGLPRSISKKSLAEPLNDDSDGIDETDYKSLIPQGSPVRPAPRRAGDTMGLDDDDEDLFNMPPPKQKILSKKSTAMTKAPLAKTKPSAASKKAAPVPEPKKPSSLSPAAKAYAAKQAKASQPTSTATTSKAPAKKPVSKKVVVESDDGDADLANDLISDDEPIAPVSRPGRRVAATKAKATKYVFSEEEDEDEDMDDEEDSFTIDDSE